MHYAVPRILHDAGLLERFFTDSYSGNKPHICAFLRAVPARLRPRALERWLGRTAPDLPPARVTSFERLGWSYAAAQRRARNSLELRRVYHDFGRRFGRAVIERGLGRADTVYA
ncbi:MAG: hypothetical protein NZM42_15245, partial [Gemmatales bacterium]|nr:hypothetical protein [Gemmatales bacterium]